MGAGHDAAQTEPLHSGSLARGKLYAQPPGPHCQLIPVEGSLPFALGAARTQAPERFT